MAWQAQIATQSRGLSTEKAYFSQGSFSAGVGLRF
jgi:hypothetical protein